ncbi:MFS transporter [Actinokineospora sp. NBRC 105648]|uniref:MFS transporter n=1 Tax=Actinokineospora sp. NBRC 105648 TaxID=3032206 RepID=UPI0024A1B8A6|nr:MFS transporter [Actinokineospora sp. NBRC 105648]GLZ43761.1 MFS transporter [Actinokineospora sp. NBRC 105648]
MTAPTPPPALRRTAIASLVGTAIEWYDFFIYGTASVLVFAPQFFPGASDLAGTLAAFSTLAVGFLARPLGGALMGHFGDRVGRKSMLVLSLLLMGTATFAIGLLPTYAQIGAWAPILLVLLRFLQGFGVGGEWGGAVLLAVENAPPGKRGFYGSFPQMGVPAGVILSNVVFLIILGTAGKQAFTEWAWRLPFLFSIVLVIAGLLVRSKIGETPEFTKVRSAGVQRSPLASVIRKHPKQILLAGGTFLANNAIGYVMIVYMLSYGTKTLKLTQNTMLTLVLIASGVWLVTLPLFSALSDRVGRRKVFTAGGLVLLVWSIPFFLLLDTVSTPLMVISVVVTALGLSATYGPQAALFAELFDADVRYSGASLGYQLGAIFGGGFAPFIAAWLQGATGSSVWVGVYLTVLAVISLVCISLLREPARQAVEAVPQPA